MLSVWNCEIGFRSKTSMPLTAGRKSISRRRIFAEQQNIRERGLIADSPLIKQLMRLPFEYPLYTAEDCIAIDRRVFMEVSSYQPTQ
jgi:hypothetical protein